MTFLFTDCVSVNVRCSTHSFSSSIEAEMDKKSQDHPSMGATKRPCLRNAPVTHPAGERHCGKVPVSGALVK